MSIHDGGVGNRMIRTRRLEIRLAGKDALRAITDGPGSLEIHLGVAVPPDWPEFPEAYSHALEVLERGPDPGPWGTYLFVSPAAESLVGSGGFKGPPDGDGSVEIGYEIAPAFRGRGYAVEAAAGLMGLALASPEVRVVSAHTLPRESASTRVLEKIGLRNIGVVEDPVDGTLWRWRIERRS